MIFSAIQFAALFLLLLVSGVFWGPWLALHRSLHVFPKTELVQIVKILARNLANPMRIMMPLCIALMTLSAWFYPQNEPGGFYCTIAAIVFILIALAITLAVELPIVNQIKAWRASPVPADWEAIRNRWVFFHVIRMAAALAGFGLFAAAIFILH